MSIGSSSEQQSERHGRHYTALLLVLLRRLWRGLVIPTILVFLVFALLGAIVVAMGVIQLQLRVHQAQVLDARFGTDVLSTFEQQVSTINKLEETVRENGPDILAYATSGSNFLQELLSQSAYVCKTPLDLWLRDHPQNASDSVTRDSHIKFCQDLIFQKINNFSAGGNVNDAPAKRKGDLINEIVSEITVEPLRKDTIIISTVAGFVNFYDAFYQKGIELKSKNDLYADYCLKLSNYLSINRIMSKLADTSIQDAKYIMYQCVAFERRPPNSFLPFNLFQVDQSKSSTDADQSKISMNANASPGISAPVDGGKVLTRESAIQAATVSELLFSYRFYKSILGPRLDSIIVAPIDLSFMVLVILSALFGAFLRHILEDIQRTERGLGGAPQSFSIFLKRSILSIMVALLFYVLSRTTLVSMLDKTVAEGTFTLNPYLVAFVAAVAGILSTETFKKLIEVGGRYVANEEEKKPSISH